MTDIRDKIRKVLALGASSNPNEAATAAATAARLMDQHRLTAADFPTMDATAIHVAADQFEWAAPLFVAIGARCGVLAFGVGETRLNYVGYAADLSAASFLFLTTYRLVDKLTDRAWKEHVAELTDPQLGRYPSLDEPGAEQEWKSSFAMGCVLKIQFSYRADLQVAAEASDVAEGTALVRARTTVPEEVKRYAEERFGPFERQRPAAASATLLPGALKEGQRTWPRR